MSRTVAEVCAVAMVVLAVVLALAALRAWRRDSQWLRSRERGPLDFVPMRAKAKRVHLGLRGLCVGALLVAALVILAA
jgi:hypothetical protein